MPELKAAAAVALLLVVAAATFGSTNAQHLMEPKGSVVDNEQGFTFSFADEVNVFGEQLLRERKHYVNRRSGRINLGSDAYISDFEPDKRRASHMLHSAETLSARGISVHQFWQGMLAPEQLSEMTSMVRENFWNSNGFTAIKGHIFTWEALQSTSSSGLSNTLQAAVFYNESSTYVVYNYVAMAFSKVALGEIMTGFSRGSSFESTYLPFTGANAVQLSKVSGIGNGTLGRFIYRIDMWPPRRGGCLSTDPTAQSDRVLATSVTQDSVLGGSLAVVSGRCPGTGARGTCFVTMGGSRISETQTAQNCSRCGSVFLACPVPPSFREGSATLSLSVNSGENAYSTGFNFVSPDEPSIGGITLGGDLQSWMGLSPQSLLISYNTANLIGDLKLRVVGYSESGLSQVNDKESTPMKVLLEAAAPRDGGMDVSPLSCPTDLAECDTHHLGFLEIVDSDSPTNSLRSRIVPLGWFVRKYYEAKQQPLWYRTKCAAMSGSDEQAQKVRTQLRQLGCPATLQQAQADASRLLRLTYCPELPEGCLSATPAQQCFASKPATNADTHGASASVCCYDQSSSRLLYQELLGSNNDAWTQRGSHSIRSHPDGMPSSASLLPGQVSFMSHWYWDALNFLYCCRWSNLGDCPYYFMYERPTPKVSAHVRGRASTAVGDPHLSSFSGRPFLFNGYGEYWLLRSDDFQVQGRFLRVGNIRNATFLVALATRVGAEPIFEATVLPADANPRFRLLRRIADTSATTEVPLTVNSPYIDGSTTILLKNASNLVIQITSNSRSIGIDLYAVEGFAFMNVFVALADTMKGQTRGLLGRWTDDAASEFVDIDDKTVAFNEDPSQFHVDFCANNLLKNVGESLLNYDGDRAIGYDKINKHELGDYRPVFYANVTGEHGQEQAVCQSDKDCVFDLRVTQNLDIARLTENFGRHFGALQSTGNTSAAYCDKPDIRGLTIGADSNLGEGQSLGLACAAPLRASRAAANVECVRQADGTLKWQPDPATLGFECHLSAVIPDDDSGVNVGLIVGIVVPVVIVVIAAVIILVVVLRRRGNAGGSAGGSSNGRGKPQQKQQQQSASSAQNSRTNLASSNSGIGGGGAGDGYDNPGHGGKRPVAAGAEPVAPPQSAQYQLQHQQQQQQQQQHIDDYDDDDEVADPRMSYQHAQQEPMEPAELNPNQYAGLQKPTHVGKSEVV